jgi:hypothetical protein
MLCSDKIYRTIEEGSGFFQHGHTYLGHPAACAGSLAVMREIEQKDLLVHVRETGAKLRAALEAQFGQHWAVGDIRGRGLFLGIELVVDKESKAPFDPGLGIAAKIKKAAFANGLMVYPMGGTVDGQNGDHVLIAPPFILEEAQIGEIIEKLGPAMESALATARAA